MGQMEPQLAKKYHPDMNKDDPNAEKKFQEINKAHEVWSGFQILLLDKDLTFFLFVQCVPRCIISSSVNL